MNGSLLPRARRVWWHGGVLLFYTLLAGGLTWPLLRHFTTHAPGDGIDDPSLIWNLWWIKARLVEQLNFDIFHVDWMFHPIDINLGFYTLTPLNGLISTPLQLAFGLIVANNLVLLSSFVLGGYGAFLLVQDLLQEQRRLEIGDWRLGQSPISNLQSRLAPVLAGLIYAFASSKLFYVSLGQFNIASSQWIPFCVLYLLRMGRSTTGRSSFRYALFAALFLTFQAWAELTYASFLLIFIALYFLWLLLVPTLGVGMPFGRSASHLVEQEPPTRSVLTAFPRRAWVRAISNRSTERSRRSLQSRLAPVLAGLVYAFASSKLFYVSLGQFNIASSQWIPFCVLYLLRMGRSTTGRSSFRYALFAALFLTFQAWAELTYASFLLIFIALYFLWLLLVPTLSVGMPFGRSASHLVEQKPPTRSVLTAFPRRAWVRAISSLQSLIPNFALLGLTFLFGISPFLWAMIPDLRREGDFFASGGGFADLFSADLMGYLMPTRLHPLLGPWVAGLPFPNDKGQQIYIGYSALVLVIIGAAALLRQPQIRVRLTGWFWLLMTSFFWLLTLGPHLRWAGHDLPISGPFVLISKLPFFSGNRYPSRYSVMLMLCVAVLVGYGVQNAGPKGRPGMRNAESPSRSRFSSTLMVFVALIFLFEHASFPLPINDFRVPEIYQKLAAQPGDFTLLELPTGWRNGARVLGKSDKLIMMQQFYQTVHGKRRLGGNTSRNPAYKFQYFTDAPLLGDLIALMNADDDHKYMVGEINAQLNQMIRQDRTIAPQVLQTLGVQYVTVHVEKSPPVLLRFVDEALPLTLVDEWHGPDWTGAPSTIRLYQVKTNSLADAWQVDVAEPLGQLFLAEGWSSLAGNGVRYATRTAADLLVNVPTDGGQLALQVFGPAPEVDFWLNGVHLASRQTLQVGARDWIELSIPPGIADQPVDRLELRFQGSLSPVSALSPPPDSRGWPIGTTGAFLPGATAIIARSAGNDVGDFAEILINGRNLALSGSEPGYNLAALDRQGSVLESVMFDTHTSAQASADMAHWLARWPTGTVIAGAVADEASDQLGVDAVNALTLLGVTGDLRGKLRWSHAFIGVVGAPSGSAVQQLSLLQPATAFVGPPVDSTQVSGGIGRIRFSRK